MAANLIRLVVVVSCLSVLHSNCKGDDKPTPLSMAVANLNEQLDAYPFGEERIRTRPLSDEELPPHVTVEEVVKAIQNWDRTEHPIDDSDYKLFQEIARTKMLPPTAKLSFHIQWHHAEPESKVEVRELWVDLSAMTGEKSGYGFRVRRQPLDERLYLELSRGYSWKVHPLPAKPSDWNAGGVVFTILNDPTHPFHALASTLISSNTVDLRGAVFDSLGKRYELDEDRVGRHENMVMLRFQLNQQPASDIQFFGIESLSQSGIRMLSRMAMRKAAEQGLDVLPLPAVGRELEFELSDTFGQGIKSSKLRGRVVIIDCWATWCGPCIKQIPQLKQLYEQHHANGLEIIGISVDENPDAAVKAYQRMDIPWPLVTIPDNDEARQLWEDAARIQTVPRVLVIDRSGVLQSDDSKLPVDRVISLLNENAKE